MLLTLILGLVGSCYWISVCVTLGGRQESSLVQFIEVHYVTGSDIFITKLDPVEHLLIAVFLCPPPLIPTIKLVSSSNFVKFGGSFIPLN